jgi:hypothetical protein
MPDSVDSVPVSKTCDIGYERYLRWPGIRPGRVLTRPVCT